MISNLRRGVHSLQVRMACADSSREYEHVKWPSSQKQLHGDCHGLQMKRGGFILRQEQEAKKQKSKW